MPRRGQDVRQEQHFLVREQPGNLEGPGVGLGHPDQFGLPSRDAAIQATEAEQGSGWWNRLFIDDGATTGIGGFTTGEQVTLAKKALATRNHERDHHPITALHGRHCRAGFFDDAHELMTENVAVLHGGNLASIQM
ncbi:hypothetical protein D3C85_1299560 [compost metagenome]